MIKNIFMNETDSKLNCGNINWEKNEIYGIEKNLSIYLEGTFERVVG